MQRCRSALPSKAVETPIPPSTKKRAHSAPTILPLFPISCFLFLSSSFLLSCRGLPYFIPASYITVSPHRRIWEWRSRFKVKAPSLSAIPLSFDSWSRHCFSSKELVNGSYVCLLLDLTSRTVCYLNCSVAFSLDHSGLKMSCLLLSWARGRYCDLHYVSRTFIQFVTHASHHG